MNTAGPPKRRRLDPRKSLVGFVVGEVTYAVAVESVREVTNPLAVVALPQSPPAVVGVADFRGVIVPVVDLRARFGLEPLPVTRKTKWIVIEASSRLVALVVDHATEVFGTMGAGLRQAPPLGPGDAVRGIAGVVDAPTGMAFVLDEQPLVDLVRGVSVGREVGRSAPPPSPRKPEKSSP